MKNWIRQLKPHLNRNDLLFCLISGILLAAAFPPLHCSFLIGIALIPWILRIRPGRNFDNVWLGLLTGILFYTGHLYWLSHAAVAGMTALILVLSLYMAGLSWVLGRLRDSAYSLPTSALVWAGVEYLRSLGPFSFAWGYLGHSLYSWKYVIPVVYWIGVPGLSFLIALLNFSLADFIRSQRLTPQSQIRKRSIIGIGCSAAIGCLFLIHGFWVQDQEMRRWEKDSIHFRVGLIQGNFSQEEKENAEPEDSLQVYLKLSETCMKEKPDLLIWPESSVTVPLNYWPSLVEKIITFVKTNSVDLLIGTVYGEYLGNDQWQFRNRAVLFQPNTVIEITDAAADFSHVQSYDKMHLVPYGEWVPLGRYWPFTGIETLIEEAGAGIFEPGQSPTIFRTSKGVAFAVAICFESTLPGYFRRVRNLGADFIVTITNDAWFKRSAGLEQHFLQSRFRAAENRCYVTRAANTGISGIINPVGQVVNKLTPQERTFGVYSIQLNRDGGK